MSEYNKRRYVWTGRYCVHSQRMQLSSVLDRWHQVSVVFRYINTVMYKENSVSRRWLYWSGGREMFILSSTLTLKRVLSTSNKLTLFIQNRIYSLCIHIIHCTFCITGCLCSLKNTWDFKLNKFSEKYKQQLQNNAILWTTYLIIL